MLDHEGANHAQDKGGGANNRPAALARLSTAGCSLPRPTGEAPANDANSSETPEPAEKGWRAWDGGGTARLPSIGVGGRLAFRKKIIGETTLTQQRRSRETTSDRVHRFQRRALGFTLFLSVAGNNVQEQTAVDGH